MDAALLREREAFKRKAMAIPTVEKRKINKTASSSSASASSASARDSSARAKLDLAQMKSIASGTSQFKFGVLARIVRYGREEREREIARTRFLTLSNCQI